MLMNKVLGTHDVLIAQPLTIFWSCSLILRLPAQHVQISLDGAEIFPSSRYIDLFVFILSSCGYTVKNYWQVEGSMFKFETVRRCWHSRTSSV